MLPITKFTYRKGLGTCDAPLCVSNILQSLFESWQEARILHPARKQLNDTLGGCIGKVVVSNAEVARLIPAEAALFYTMHKVLRGYCP